MITKQIVRDEKTKGKKNNTSKVIIKKMIVERLAIFKPIIDARYKIVFAKNEIFSLIKKNCSHKRLDEKQKYEWTCKYCFAQCDLLCG